ncbi:MAG: quinone oxidoreductase [Rhodospirillales bacterium]|nr:quinone oxidoreductase [Rhodospirillales bacterium]
MTKAFRFYETGGTEVLKWEDVEIDAPGKGEVLIRQAAVGLNYIDVYHRAGLYPLQLPSGIGVEGAGVVEEVGRGVKEFKKGDRVAYMGGPLGAYSEERIMPANRLVKLPKEIDFETAAAIMLQGLTAHMLIRKVYKVNKGDTVLFHAAAGGVGLIACQWLKHLGVKVVGTVGSEEKAKLAKRHGCTWPVNYRKDDFLETVKKVTKGKGVPVVYDSVGKDTFMKSLDCLAPRGMLVVFGNASGPVDNFNLNLLTPRGSLYVTRPTIMNYTSDRDEMVKATRELFKVVKSGAVKVRIGQAYALKDAAQAHKDLEARKTTGSTVLLP